MIRASTQRALARCVLSLADLAEVAALVDALVFDGLLAAHSVEGLSDGRPTAAEFGQRVLRDARAAVR